MSATNAKQQNKTSYHIIISYCLHASIETKLPLAEAAAFFSGGRLLGWLGLGSSGLLGLRGRATSCFCHDDSASPNVVVVCS